MSSPRRRPLRAASPTSPTSNRVTRDLLIVGFALGLAGIDVLFLGARASTLTFCTTLLMSPLVLRYDERRREEGDR